MKDEYNCKDCINRGTEICENCVTTKYPSGRTSKPSHYQIKEEALLRISVQTVPPIGIMPRHIHEERRADELAKANIKIEDLNVRVDSLNTEVSNVSKEKQIAEQKTEELTNQLNTCYYIVETNKVLKEKKILEKRFLGRTKIMEGDFDRSAFVKADKRSLTEIPTGSTSAKVVSKQPTDSYDIVDENCYKVVKITNAILFWEKSDFLVIEVK